MFTAKELSAIDRRHFSVIRAGCLAVTIQSRNTGHCWHILYGEPRPGVISCRIWHTHRKGTAFHEHGHGRNLAACIRQIKSHDAWQLKKDANRRRFKNHTAI